MTCDHKDENGKTCGGIMTRTLNTDTQEVWFCTLCGHQKIINKNPTSKEWTIPSDIKPDIPEGTEKSTKGSPSFTDKEIKQGYRRAY